MLYFLYIDRGKNFYNYNLFIKYYKNKKNTPMFYK